MVLLAMLALWSPAQAQTLVADLSSHLIAITTGFTGTDVVLFGAIDQPGDVAVVIEGPETALAVRRKDRMAGIWMNNETLKFSHVPGFYEVAASKPLDTLLPPAVAQRHEIGLDHVRMLPRVDADAATVAEFRSALIRNKQREGLYGTEVGEVAFLGQRLFRTSIYFPANVPTGLYTVSVFLIRDQDVVGAQTTPLAVSKIGFSADIYDFAQRDGLVYGLLGVLLAVGAGWLAGTLFRKN
ncbi:MAG: TIGR02186 family protein [Azospirillaceae bacterium]|nr:TIGR02186 family protein [Azospirillaceae bacterium]